MHRIRIVHESYELDQELEVRSEVIIEDDARAFRTWMVESLKMNPARVAHETLLLATRVVWHQAYEAGECDALEFGEPQISQFAHPNWKSGYDTGFTAAMERAYRR